MKFIVAVVMLALAAHASAGAVQTVDVAKQYAPVGTWGPALVNLGAPHGLGLPIDHGLGGVVVGNPWAAPWIGLRQGLLGVGSIHAGIPALHAGIPPLHAGLSAIHAGIPALHAGVPLGLGHGHDSQYVAANRGSVHVAPLTGHIQSVNSANLQPAPGTTW